MKRGAPKINPCSLTVTRSEQNGWLSLEKQSILIGFVATPWGGQRNDGDFRRLSVFMRKLRTARMHYVGWLDFGDRTMNQFYYDAVTKMEQMGVDDEYIQGWQAGFLQNPKREEQRVTEAYEAGYADGEEKSTDNFDNWAQS